MVSIIVAVARNGIIGAGGQMPWHISEDLRMFRRVTTGHPVVMGRRTFESLGRPLPARTNVVVTRNRDWTAEGVAVAGSLAEAFAMFPPGEEVFVIGGGEIYAAALPLADRVYLTRVDFEYQGDVRFPEWDETVWRGEAVTRDETGRRSEAEWRLVSSEHHERGEVFPHPFEFQVYERE
jgi:dihydrofolate reductase